MVAVQANAMITAELLRRIRNDLPMPATIAALGRQGPPAKMSEGYFRFLCPGCGEMLATVNPRNNLAHCFAARKTSITSTCSSPSTTTSVRRLLSWSAGSTTIRPDRPRRKVLRRQQRSQVLILLCQSDPTDPQRLRKTAGAVALGSSRIFNNSANGLHDAEIRTALIRQRMRSQFGSGQVQPCSFLEFVEWP